MEALQKEYQDRLNQIKSLIQDSDELKNYLDEEGDEEYKALIDKFENDIHEVYTDVADNNPLQIIALEDALLDHDFEALYLPKAMGYTVLRGIKNENYEYERPQKQFKKILEFIISSSNFDQVKRRVGQSLQIGFALSSDIWITNIINVVNNKQVKNFLESQNMLKYHDLRNRKTAYIKYAKQFQSLNFYTGDFPTNRQEVIREFKLLKKFLLYRADTHPDQNASLMPHISKLIHSQDQFEKDPRYSELLFIIALKYDLEDSDREKIKSYFSDLRQGEDFDKRFFDVLVRLHGEFEIDPKAELRLVNVFDLTLDDKISAFYKVINIIHGQGYMNEEAINASRDFYYSNEGLSFQNTAIRASIFGYFKRLLKTLQETDYADYFEINKVMVQYINVFDNQQFNHDIKNTSLIYIKKLLRHFTDKRGKDYQDIKKYVWSNFKDLGFMSEKELKEQFKTKRKAKPKTA